MNFQIKIKDYLEIRIYMHSNLIKKFNEADWHSIFWKPFWFLVSTLILGSIFVWIEMQKIFVDLTKREWLLVIFFSVIVLIILDFIFNLKDNLKIQKIRNQPSWVYYGFWGLVIGPAVVIWLLVSLLNIIYQVPVKSSYLLYEHQIFFNTILLIIFSINFYFISKKELKKEDMRFASGSVGIDDDELDFKNSAKNVATGLQKIEDYISVVCLYGGLGFGKSSYARMIIESFDQNKTLYTYISLTETNEAKDFSKLFAERWMRTLKQRYPKVDTTLSMPLMQSVLRESGNSLIASIFSLVPWLNKGLVKTKAKFFDEYYKPPINPKTSDDVANIFGNVSDIKEDIWVIMVDEIERAQFDEIYRVIEIIERFKNEGRTGLPIKLIFLLCISTPELQNHLDDFKSTKPKATVISQFFTDGKSVRYHLYLPPTSGKMPSYIISRIKKFSLEFNLMTKDIINDIYPDTLSDPTSEFFEDQKKSLSYIVGKLSSRSTRLVSQCFHGLALFYISFRNKSGELQKPPIRFSDLLLMEYVKIKYPYLILFFERTISLLLADYNEVGGGITHEGLSAYIQQKRFKENKFRLADWVTEVTGAKISDKEKGEIESIIGLVSYRYFDYLRGNYQEKRSDLYFDSLALPKNLYDYLSLVSDAVVTSFDRYNQIYLKHRNKKIKLRELSGSDLIGYSRFIADIRRASIELHLDIVNEISRRILEKEVEIKMKDVGDTIYDDFIYQFIFQVVTLAEKDRKSREFASEELTITYQKLKDILLSSDVTTGAKYIIINSFTNNTRGIGSEIHSRLENAFLQIKKYWYTDLKDIISKVFSEAEKKYYEDKIVIYDCEENFFFTMYQGWSGKANATEEIEKIRELARRDLDKHPDAIALYWNKYKINKEWVDFGDVLRDDPFFGHDNNFELYMPLKTLIEITETANITDNEIKEKLIFWRKNVDDPRYKDFAAIKDDPGTLKAVLVSRELLDINLLRGIKKIDQ